MHTAATCGQPGSDGSGRRALAARLRTLPGVSAPSRVVRSTIEIAVSIAQAFAVVLIDRVPSTATLDSTPTWSTPGSPCRKARNSACERVTGANGASGSGDVRPPLDSAPESSTCVMWIILLLGTVPAVVAHSGRAGEREPSAA